VKRAILILVVGLICTVGVASCSQQGSPDSPAKAIETYLNVRNSSDLPKMLATSCKDWEGKAQAEADSFKPMSASLQDMVCAENGKDGSFTIVICQGKLITQYNGESNTRDLADKPYRTIQEDGQWKMCGYKATK
jgi:hypothetical protein